MPISNYGVIKASVDDFTPGSDRFAHFQVILKNPKNGNTFEADINVRSKDGSEVLYYCDNNYMHPFVDKIAQGLGYGYTALGNKSDSMSVRNSTGSSLSVDFLRSGLFHLSKMRPLGMESPVNNDLNSYLRNVVLQAKTDENSVVYVFGQYFEDSIHPQHANPVKGIHDIHMNQGNFGSWEKDNGIYQDGALFIHIPSQNQWIAIFLAFQSQSFQTDEKGNPIGSSWSELHGGTVYEKEA